LDQAKRLESSVARTGNGVRVDRHEEKAIIERCKQGDLSAFDDLVRVMKSRSMDLHTAWPVIMTMRTTSHRRRSSRSFRRSKASEVTLIFPRGSSA